MQRLLPTSVALKLSLAICLNPVLPVHAGAIDRSANEEEYQVYKAFLNSSYVETTDYSLYEKLGIYFIYNVKYEIPEELSDFLKTRVGLSLDHDLIKNFITANRSPMKINRKRLPENIKFSAQFMKTDVYSFSRVGFNAKMDESLFYASFSSMMEDGHGALFYLRKIAGTWSVEKAAAVWMYGASVHPFNP